MCCCMDSFVGTLSWIGEEEDGWEQGQQRSNLMDRGPYYAVDGGERAVNRWGGKCWMFEFPFNEECWRVIVSTWHSCFVYYPIISYGRIKVYRQASLKPWNYGNLRVYPRFNIASFTKIRKCSYKLVLQYVRDNHEVCHGLCAVRFVLTCTAVPTL